MLKDSLISRLVSSENEVDRLDFKAEFDTTSKQQWCEVVKDIVAMANTRGGVIIFGVEDDGHPSNRDVTSLASLDPATVTDKIAAYAGVQFAAIRLQAIERFGIFYPAIVVGRSSTPIVFEKPGNYPVQGDKQSQKTAFSQGTVYFRHGAKSEPANNDDLRDFIDRRLERVARKWRTGVKRVISAPLGYEVKVVPPNMKLVPSEAVNEVRLVNDADAPTARFVSPDMTHPYRQKELIVELRKRLNGKHHPTPHTVQCVRRLFKTDENPTFTYVPKFGSRQYSTAFADWIVEKVAADGRFLENACSEYSRQQAVTRANNNRPR